MKTESTPDNIGPTPAPQSRSAPIVERAPLPIVEVQGSKHVVSYVNSAFCRLMGKNRSELLGNPFAAIVPGGDECVPILDRVYQTGEAVTHAREEDSETDHAYWLFAMWPALDANELPVGVIIQLTKAADYRQNVTAINEALLISGLRQHELTETAEKLNAQLQAEITERKRAQVALQAAQYILEQHAINLEKVVVERTASLRETVGQLEAFSYSIAHDMRAPLRSMRGFAQALIEEHAGALDAKGMDYLGRIARSANRLDRLIQDVLSYSKLLGGPVVNVPVDLNQLLQDIFATYPDWQPDKAQIEIEEPLPKVLGNEAFLSQCISNLVSNAVKFVAPGTIAKVKIWAETNDGEVRLYIRDNGIGIAADKHDRIFRMFERIHPEKEYAGTGIGLTIARKAMERMGGELGFDSELGQGSTFWIQLKKG